MSQTGPKSRGNRLAVSGHVQWQPGDTVYARYVVDKSRERGDPARWWYEPWWVIRVGPRRLFVSNLDDDDDAMRGYVARWHLEEQGWGIVYGSWQTVKAIVFAEWSEEYVRYRLHHEAPEAGKTFNPNTLGGQMRLDRRIDALAVLGLPVTADEATIKSTYRRLAMELHPDRGGSGEAFVRLQSAYERLTKEWRPSLWELVEEAERRVRAERGRGSAGPDGMPGA
jgi:hypothetical protein